jgi:hypothetical protein
LKGPDDATIEFMKCTEWHQIIQIYIPQISMLGRSVNSAQKPEKTISDSEFTQQRIKNV